ncbi:hypothetical protein KIW84_012037 [Lathyrus oleraceus]|uniref:Mei2-like C-terminal RNA recognition motif domain-containing protein n=1 Tax=Pisum sativum TaxID=3888 RepID=A0A9D5GW05_PEA|nr:hypothetical protein KIW84_012037 [Pisum sativum]
MLTIDLPTNNHLIQSPPIWHRRFSYPAESMTPHCVNFVPHNMLPHFGLIFHNQRSMVVHERHHMINLVDTTYKCVRSRRNVGTSNSVDLKLYELDTDCIKRGEDNRRKLMIKNIPNKNKGNVGYAFINMVDPSFIVPFYKVFNEIKWEKFNSEKAAPHRESQTSFFNPQIPNRV